MREMFYSLETLNTFLEFCGQDEVEDVGLLASIGTLAAVYKT